MAVGKNDVIHWLLDHRMRVGQRLSSLGNDLAIRGRRHDNTYSETVEMNQFAAFYNVEPGDPDRDKKRQHHVDLVVAIHKQRNDYYHEFFDHGIMEMNMLQLMEYICDRITLWEEHKAGNISPINYEIFMDEESRDDLTHYVLAGLPELSPDLESIVTNTVYYILHRNEVIKQIVERSERIYGEAKEE
ncbi:MAG: DUF5662 family protein [Lachnospiraceae bacterium]|nr:DUF5662 family protein [Lachnospiraceae bacterium]